MATPGGPQSESELLTQLPSSQRAGALPRELLPPGERVLFETKPGIFHLYPGRIIFIVLIVALWTALGVGAPSAAAGAAFFAAPFLIWLLLLYLEARNTVYALTDRRVIRISGIRGTDFQDASFSQIHNLAIDASTIRFDTTPPMGYAPGAAPARSRVIRWVGLTDAPRVYAFVQLAMAFVIRQMNVIAIGQEKLDQIARTSIPCTYCGSPVDLTTLSPTNSRCPTCTGPVVLPG